MIRGKEIVVEGYRCFGRRRSLHRKTVTGWVSWAAGACRGFREVYVHAGL